MLGILSSTLTALWVDDVTPKEHVGVDKDLRGARRCVCLLKVCPYFRWDLREFWGRLSLCPFANNEKSDENKSLLKNVCKYWKDKQSFEHLGRIWYSLNLNRGPLMHTKAVEGPTWLNYENLTDDAVCWRNKKLIFSSKSSDNTSCEVIQSAVNRSKCVQFCPNSWS